MIDYKLFGNGLKTILRLMASKGFFSTPHEHEPKCSRQVNRHDVWTVQLIKQLTITWKQFI